MGDGPGSDPRSLLDGYPVIVELPVLWGDMDAFGHVNNTCYFRYFESARIAYFERLGFDRQMADSGVGPILAHTQCRFRVPLTYPDRLSVGARVTETGTDRFLMQYAVASHSAGRIAAEGDGRIVCFDYRQGVKAPLPDSVRERLGTIENGGD